MYKSICVFGYEVGFTFSSDKRDWTPVGINYDMGCLLTITIHPALMFFIEAQ
jgi:hypothetical protein